MSDTSMVQYSWETKLSISSWRMQMSRTATDWTLSAGKPPLDPFPQERAHGVAHDAVHGAPCLLGIVEGPVQLLGAA